MKKQILTLISVFVVSTSALAQQKTNWFIGSDSRITCDEEGEADRIVLAMADEGGGRNQFKESVKKSGLKLRLQLMDLLTKKEVSARTFEEEMNEYVKKAVCLTHVVSKGAIADGFEDRFKKNLNFIENQLKENKLVMPSYNEAVTLEEQGNALANDLVEANRGPVAFVFSLFE